MPEAGQPPQLFSGALLRRRRSAFRRHSTCCLALKECCQSAQIRFRRSEHPDAARCHDPELAAPYGYALTDARGRTRSACEPIRKRRGNRRPARHSVPRRPARWALSGAGTHLYLLPQNTAHSLWAPFNRPHLQKSPAAAHPPAGAAPRTRNARRALRAQRRFRPMTTTSSAARPWRR